MKEDNKNLIIQIDSSTIIRAILLVVLVWGLYIFRNIVFVILTAVVIASGIEPFTLQLVKRKVPRILAVIMIYLTTALVIGFVFYSIVPLFLGEVANVLNRAPDFVNSLNLLGGGEGSILEPGGVFQGISDSLSLANVASQLKASIESLSGSVIGLISTIFGGALSFMLIITISFYLAVQKDGIADFLRIVTPYKHEKYALDLWARSQKKIGRWLQGQLVLMAIVGILVFLGLTIFGVPNALLLAIFAALFELIPLFGPILASIPAIAIAFLSGGLKLAVIVVFLYALIQQFENNLIYPLVVKKVVGVPSLVVIIALIMGAQIAGFIGIILSVPVAAVVMEYMVDFGKKKHAFHEEEEKKIRGAV